MAPRAGALRFGVSRSNGGAALLDGARRFCAALTAELGSPVDVVIAYDYGSLLKTLSASGAELAWVPPLVQSRALAAGAQLVALSRRDGALGYASALVVHTGSRVQTVADLVAIRAAWNDRESASGYVVPRQHLLERGLDPARTFKSERFYGGTTAACRAIVDGEADLSATFVKSGADIEAAQAEVGKSFGGKLRVLELTRRIPPDGIVVAAHVDPTQTAALTRALHQLHTHPSGRDALTALLQAERLAAVPDSVLRELRKMA